MQNDNQPRMLPIVDLTCDETLSDDEEEEEIDQTSSSSDSSDSEGNSEDDSYSDEDYLPPPLKKFKGRLFTCHKCSEPERAKRMRQDYCKCHYI